MKDRTDRCFVPANPNGTAQVSTAYPSIISYAGGQGAEPGISDRFIYNKSSLRGGTTKQSVLSVVNSR
ncbi:hypothetical protein DU508_22290 [Pedobacter chinensis]|uniref:Uncharacterized protein n=1 Tax=Pedobacter chinensis TaxID=2282421 RepID=A0A369PPL9_9SPHI|nr:hypothetical protein DU508_22290 [Pedobacter chinensis]